MLIDYTYNTVDFYININKKNHNKSIKIFHLNRKYINNIVILYNKSYKIHYYNNKTDYGYIIKYYYKYEGHIFFEYKNYYININTLFMKIKLYNIILKLYHNFISKSYYKKVNYLKYIILLLKYNINF